MSVPIRAWRSGISDRAIADIPSTFRESSPHPDATRLPMSMKVLSAFPPVGRVEKVTKRANGGIHLLDPNRGSCQPVGASHVRFPCASWIMSELLWLVVSPASVFVGQEQPISRFRFGTVRTAPAFDMGSGRAIAVHVHAAIRCEREFHRSRMSRSLSLRRSSRGSPSGRHACTCGNHGLFRTDTEYGRCDPVVPPRRSALSSIGMNRDSRPALRRCKRN